jgi:hypothetical protein
MGRSNSFASVSNRRSNAEAHPWRLSRHVDFKVADTPAYGYPVVAGKRIFVEDKNSVMLWILE